MHADDLHYTYGKSVGFFGDLYGCLTFTFSFKYDIISNKKLNI